VKGCTVAPLAACEMTSPPDLPPKASLPSIARPIAHTPHAFDPLARIMADSQEPQQVRAPGRRVGRWAGAAAPPAADVRCDVMQNFGDEDCSWMFCPLSGALLQFDTVKGVAFCKCSGYQQSLDGEHGAQRARRLSRALSGWEGCGAARGCMRGDARPAGGLTAHDAPRQHTRRGSACPPIAVQSFRR
jgi:hypothetical protein